MKSLKLKLLLPVLCMFLIFTTFLTLQLLYSKDNLKSLEDLHQKSFATLTKADELKLNVVQVQQWLTDISATRAQDGLDDGFEIAKTTAQNVTSLIAELKQINPDKTKELEEIENAFKPYYETGKKMAQEYIDGGPEKGNKIMGDFDSTAEAINEKVDKFKEASYEKFNTEIGNIELNIDKSIFMSFIAITIGIVITCLAWLYITQGILKPIFLILNKFKDLAANEGDLTQKIQVNSSDEIGELADTINKFLDNFRLTILDIKNTSNKLEVISDQVNTVMGDLNNDVADILASTREVSAGMQQTAASTQTMDNASNEIGNVVKAIANETQNGTIKANEIKTRAIELGSNAELSQKNAQEICNNNQIKLKEVIHESKSVEKINDLSNAILSISEQTNLLALNASIEAARAGEAGKGFAVVAESIRKLAEESKTSANGIQNIAKSVVNSVSNLSSNSEDILRFIDTQVLKDYEALVKTGEIYNEDAKYIDNMVKDFNNTSEELLAGIEELLASIGEIAVTTNQNAKEVTNIAGKSEGIAAQVNNVVNLAHDSKLKSNELYNLVSKFTV